LIGSPYFPITPTFRSWDRSARSRCLEVANRVSASRSNLSGYGPDAADDRSIVLELSERVRDTIQEKLYDNLVKRGSAFL